MLSISTALSGVNSPARSFYCRLATEPLADACGTLRFHGTPVENHWSSVSTALCPYVLLCMAMCVCVLVRCEFIYTRSYSVCVV